MRQAFAFSVCALLLSCDGSARQPPEHPTPPAAPTPKPITPVAAPQPTPRTPAALEASLAEYDRLVASNGDVSKLRPEIDRLAGQHDAHLSRLFWYTDLDAAKAEAQKTGKPILSLRMLGRLDEELSCANSRMFRVVLYANPQVSQFLRDTYVLHWSSERPVPHITVDFGDGRVVQRTVTGNSVHYVLDAQGRLVDALPGLYGPAAFEKGLRQSLDLARKSGELSDDESAKTVAKYHSRAFWNLTASWKRQLKRVYGDSYGSYLDEISLPSVGKYSWPDPLYSSLPAAVVNNLTMTKQDMEAPDVVWAQPDIKVSGSYGDWTKVAAKNPREHLAPQSRSLIELQAPRDWSTRDALPLDATQLDKRLGRLERRITEESLRNEYVFHGALHNYLAKPARVAFTAANDYVYTKLFMTPQSDAWLGLMPTEAITGLPGDGIVATRKP